RLLFCVRMNADAGFLQGVAHAAAEEVAPERALEPEPSTSLEHVVDAALVLVRGVEQLDVELELAVEEPGFGKVQAIVLRQGTVRQAQPELLAATGEVGRVADVEITLFHLDDTDDVFEAAEAGADRELAGVALVHGDHEVFPVRDVGVL